MFRFGSKKLTIKGSRCERIVVYKSSRIFSLLWAIFFLIFPLTGRALEGDPSTRTWITPEVRAPRLSQRFFYSTSANAEVSYHVYLPEEYGTNKSRRFPVVYWLHGHRGGVKEMPQLVAHFDNAMRTGKMPQALIVLPNGMAESMWCNSKDGSVPMETVIVKELVAHIDSTYRVVPSREGRMIEGFSMGGYGAARLGIKYPEIFGAVSILGAGPLQQEFNSSVGPAELAPDRIRILRNVYGDDQEFFRKASPWVLAEQNADSLRSRSRIRVMVGARDSTQEPSKSFSLHLKRLGIPHDFFLVPNVGHNPMAIFRAIDEENWDFYQAAFAKLSSAISAPLEISSPRSQDAASARLGEVFYGGVQRDLLPERLR